MTQRISELICNRNTLRKEDGAFADIFAVKGDIVIKTPDALTDAEAATQGISIATMVKFKTLRRSP